MKTLYSHNNEDIRLFDKVLYRFYNEHEKNQEIRFSQLYSIFDYPKNSKENLCDNKHIKFLIENVVFNFTEIKIFRYLSFYRD